MPDLFEWIIFHLIIGSLLAVDLFLFQRKAHTPTLKEASIWSIIWIATAVIFNIHIFISMDNSDAVDFTTAYVVEKMLSVDNLFVFAVIFTYFAIDSAYQHKILFWGVLGAIITRGAFIFAGIHLLENFHWFIYVFAIVLIYSGIKLLKNHERPTDPNKNPIVNYAKKFFPLTSVHGSKFFINNSGKVMATPLFLALIAVESTDIIFALDSVPAVLAITDDLFIAYTSNIFAVLGLRSLYFLLIHILKRLRYFNVGLCVLLMYLGAKMLLAEVIEIPTLASLAIVASILTVTVIASLIRSRQT